MLKTDQEAEYLNDQEQEQVVPEKYVGVIFDGSQKYWLDPRWDDFVRLYSEGRHQEASELAILIRREWNTGG